MKQKDKKNKKSKVWMWPVKIFILAISLSFVFSTISELSLSRANIIVSIIVILIFIAVSILFDMLGLAVASSNIEHFTAMASRKVKGSKQAIALNKNADKVSSVCADVIGDVCGILSGAAGASIISKISLTGNFTAVIVASSISAVIAGLTIFGKASLKRVAMRYSDQITLKFAKLINIFTKKD